MATKKTTKAKEVAVVSAETKKSTVIKGPRVTEKAALASSNGVYTFNVAKNATKNEVKKAIQALYKVTPVKVGITLVKEKKVFVRGNRGVKQGGKKAVVYLKKGDKIEFA